MTKTVKENIRIRYRHSDSESLDEGTRAICRPKGKAPYFRSKEHGNILLSPEADGVLTGIVQYPTLTMGDGVPGIGKSAAVAS